jgi:aspartyl-tRNA(Asn)/glutamyl-tRNA(Gln) amidotransferase subunit A
LAVVQHDHTHRSLPFSNEASCERATAASVAAIRARAALNAFCSVDESGALERARRIDAGRVLGVAGPLAGMVLGLKDNIARAGRPLGCCSRMLEGYVSPYDATVVRRLEEAGAVIVGATNMDEFAMGSSTEHSAYGPTLHPLDPDRVPGGSSGGSAAAVAAGLVHAALGSDTGGSIRQPASFCGVVGLKPTYGRVSRYGLVAFASSLDQIGPLTRTVRDAALILEVIAGEDPADPTSSGAPVPSYTGALTGDVRGLRIGVPSEYLSDDVEPAVCATVRERIEGLRKLGAVIRDVRIPLGSAMVGCYHAISTAEASSNLARYESNAAGTVRGVFHASRAHGFGPEVRRRIMLGTYLLREKGAWYRKSQEVRRLITEGMAALFGEIDVIVSPTTPTTAFKAGARSDRPIAMYRSDCFTVGASLAGLPAVSVPCGSDGAGLPIGLQIVGPRFSEGLILRVAECVERM